MKFAYADPPYLGLCNFYQHNHPDGRCWDDLETHALLIQRLSVDYEAWALSMGTTQLQRILPLCPPDVRIGAWVKSWCSFKKGVGQAYAWEPVLFRGGRKFKVGEVTVRDYFEYPASQRRGFKGAKPEAVLWWIFRFLRARPDDDFSDLYVGSGAVTKAWEHYSSQLSFEAVA